MICFLRKEKPDTLFEFVDGSVFINVLDENEVINLSNYIMSILLLLQTHDSLIINIFKEMANKEKLKIVLSKNLDSSRISYMIS